MGAQKQTKKIAKKTTTKKPALNKAVSKKLKSKKTPEPIEKKITLVCLVASIVIVAASLCIGFFFNPEVIAERKMKRLASDYYENYFYEKFVSTIGEGDFDEAFEKYNETGFAPVYLRQLLLFDNERNAEYEKYFNSVSYKCDKNATKIQVTPVAPYGKKNYKVNYTFSCNYN